MKIADAYLTGSGAPNRSLPSSPGRRVEFRQQHAVIVTEADALVALRLVDCQVEVVEGCEQQIVDAMNACGTGANAPKAEVKVREPLYLSGEPGSFEVRYEMPVSDEDKEPARMPNNHKIDCDCVMCERIRATWTAPA